MRLTLWVFAAVMLGQVAATVLCSQFLRWVSPHAAYVLPLFTWWLVVTTWRWVGIDVRDWMGFRRR